MAEEEGLPLPILRYSVTCPFRGASSPLAGCGVIPGERVRMFGGSLGSVRGQVTPCPCGAASHRADSLPAGPGPASAG